LTLESVKTVIRSLTDLNPYLGSPMTEAAILQNRDYTVIIARSPGDNQPTSPEFKRAWEQARPGLLALYRQCAELDPDCLTLYNAAVFNGSVVNPVSCSSEAEMIALLDSYDRHQAIALEETVKLALDDYFTRKANGQTKPNGEIILVILDREPQNRIKLIKLLVEATQKMETQEELGITFIQVGDDVLTRGFLKSLDDDLATAGARLDIADTKSIDELDSGSLTDVLMGAIYD
jgi:hypothetical protein